MRPRNASLYGTMGSMRGMRHVPNALTACMGGYRCLQAGFSCTVATTTRGDRLGTSIHRRRQRLARAHASMHGLRLRETMEARMSAPRAQCIHRVHGRLPLLAGWL